MTRPVAYGRDEQIRPVTRIRRCQDIGGSTMLDGPNWLPLKSLYYAIQNR